MQAWQIDDNGTLRNFSSEANALKAGENPTEVTLPDAARRESSVGELIELSLSEITERENNTNQLITTVRIGEIEQRLIDIDSLSIRALRTKGIVGRGQPQDDASLLALDDEAIELRAELATLQGA